MERSGSARERFLKGPSPGTEEDVAGFFRNSRFAFFLNCLNRSLQMTIQSNNGFPSLLEPIKSIFIFFSPDGTLGVNKEASERIRLSINVSYLFDTENKLIAEINHELYHIIADFRHQESIQITQLRKCEESLKKSILSNKHKLDSWIAYESQDLREIANIDFVYQRETAIYWNYIIDMGLSVLAMELEDQIYIKEEIEGARYSIDFYHHKMLELKVLAKKEKGSASRYNLYMLLQFLVAYSSMPRNILPFILIKDYWARPRSGWPGYDHHRIAWDIVNRFEHDMKESTEAYGHVMTLWNHMKQIARDMNIWSDPLDPNLITRQIHNTQSLRSAKEGYKLFNQLFYDFYKKVEVCEPKGHL